MLNYSYITKYQDCLFWAGLSTNGETETMIDLKPTQDFVYAWHRNDEHNIIKIGVSSVGVFYSSRYLAAMTYCPYGLTLLGIELHGNRRKSNARETELLNQFGRIGTSECTKRSVIVGEWVNTLIQLPIEFFKKFYRPKGEHKILLPPKDISAHIRSKAKTNIQLYQRLYDKTKDKKLFELAMGNLKDDEMLEILNKLHILNVIHN